MTGLIGIYSNPAHVIAFTDGEVRQEFSICFRARSVGGEPRPSDETSEAVWVERDRIADLDVHPSIRLRIEHGHGNRAEPYYTCDPAPSDHPHPCHPRCTNQLVSRNPLP